MATEPYSSFCGSSQWFPIGNVTREVDEVEDEEERDDSPVRLLHRVQVVMDLLHFANSVFQEVNVN